MNSGPSSETVPIMWYGNTRRMCMIASSACLSASYFTDRFTLHPAAMSVTVGVKQNLPDVLPPSCPNKAISMRPGTASFQSVQVRIGVYGFNSVPRIGKGSASGGLRTLWRELSIDRRRAHPHEQVRLDIGEVALFITAQQRHQHRGALLSGVYRPAPAAPLAHSGGAIPSTRPTRSVFAHCGPGRRCDTAGSSLSSKPPAASSSAPWKRAHPASIDQLSNHTEAGTFYEPRRTMDDRSRMLYSHFQSR